MVWQPIATPAGVDGAAPKPKTTARSRAKAAASAAPATTASTTASTAARSAVSLPQVRFGPEEPCDA